MQLEIVSSQDPHVEGSVAGPGGAPIHQEPIRVADPGARCAAMAPALSSAFARVLASGRYILGPEVAACEAELEDYVGVPAVGVGCGTDGLILALRAVGVQPGDEVVTAAHTATATVAAIQAVGAEPVLADIAADSRCIDPASVARLIGPRTRAIVAVHMFGEPADAVTLAALAAAHGIALIEDCAQAHGARIDGRHVGTFGEAGAFSFYPTKNVGAIGDGGAVVSRDPAIVARLRGLRQYGWDGERKVREPGFCSRLDELQAAFVRVGLARLDADLARRREIAARYDAALAKGDGVAPTIGPGHALHLYVIEHPRRDELAEALGRRSIDTALHYPRAIHQEPAYAELRADDLERTEALYARMLTLPLYAELDDEAVARICAALEELA